MQHSAFVIRNSTTLQPSEKRKRPLSDFQGGPEKAQSKYEERRAGVCAYLCNSIVDFRNFSGFLGRLLCSVMSCSFGIRLRASQKNDFIISKNRRNERGGLQISCKSRAVLKSCGGLLEGIEELNSHTLHIPNIACHQGHAKLERRCRNLHVQRRTSVPLAHRPSDNPPMRSK